MKRVLEDLYFGEIQPNIHGINDSKISESMQVIDENENILMKFLNGKERKLFVDIINAFDQATGEIAVENFICGFKFGARIIAEVAADD